MHTYITIDTLQHDTSYPPHVKIIFIQGSRSRPSFELDSTITIGSLIRKFQQKRTFLH